MSRRESLVGGEVVAEDAAEQAEKKRKQDEQRAPTRGAKESAEALDTENCPPVVESRGPKQGQYMDLNHFLRRRQRASVASGD